MYGKHKWYFPLECRADVPRDFGHRLADSQEAVSTLMLQCAPGSSVYSVEAGHILSIGDFGNSALNSKYVMIQGQSGTVMYGNILPQVRLEDRVGPKSKIGSTLGDLHVGLYVNGTIMPVGWFGLEKPRYILDPTELLLSADLEVL